MDLESQDHSKGNGWFYIHFFFSFSPKNIDGLLYMNIYIIFVIY